MGALNGRSALVTGGGGGIGAAVARRLAAEGAAVTVWGRNVERLTDVAEAIGGRWTRVDLLDRRALESAAADLAGAGGPDILVNNAGIALGAALTRTSDEEWDRLQQVNVHTPFALCRALMPGMAERGWGRVVNIASLAGLTGQAYTSAYCASKHALVGLTRALAVEYATKHVTVNAVAPGWVATDMAAAAVERIVQSTGRSEDQARGTLEAASPQRRMVQPEEVAALVELLCRDEAQGIHGQAIPVDGGTVMR